MISEFERISLKSEFKFVIQILKKMKERVSQGKIFRHETAKQKHLIYQRSISSKKISLNSNSYVPPPGKFAIQLSKNKETLPKVKSQEPQIKFTSNIKSILRERNASPVAEVLSEAIFKKVEVCQRKEKNEISAPFNFKRPISAKIYEDIAQNTIEDSLIVKNAVEYDRIESMKNFDMKKNTFQVRPRTNIPKHIHGFQTVKLNLDKRQNQEALPENDERKKFNQQVFSEIQKKNFLPVEYYLIGDLTPDELMTKYKNKEGLLMGYSKWININGTNTWKNCRILGYSTSQERWEIEWLHNTSKKFVSRNNLYFEEEDKKKFDELIQRAEAYRKESQTYIKYNTFIDLIDTPVEQISNQRSKKIVILACGKHAHSKANIEYIQNQIEKMYLRANHQVEFNLKLPFNEEYRKTFEGYLPKKMFAKEKNSVRVIKNNNASKEVHQLFVEGLAKIKENCVYTSKKKIKILQVLNLMNEELDKHSILRDFSNQNFKKYKSEQFQKVLQTNLTEYFYKIGCKICDIEHHIAKEMDPIYLNKKTYGEEGFKQITDKYRKFLLLVNFRIEELLRDSMCSKIASLTNQIKSEKNCVRKKNHLWIYLEIDIKDGQFEVSPQPSKAKEIFLNFHKKITTQISEIKCVNKSYIEEVRPQNKLRILSPVSNPNQLIPQVKETYDDFMNTVEEIFVDLKIFTDKLKQLIDRIFGLAGQVQKRFQKKCTYSQIDEITTKLVNTQKQLEDLTLLDEIKVSIFAINIKEIKEKVNNKVTCTMKQISRLLLDKISKDNEKIQKGIQLILYTISKEPNTINDLIEVEDYVYNQMPSEMEKINEKVKTLAEKLNLLEKTNQLVNYKEFEGCCQIYLKPLKLKKARQEIMGKIQNLYKKNFSEDLIKEAFAVIDEVKACEKIFKQCLTKRTLKQMDESFQLFSQLHDNLENSYHQMLGINAKEKSLKWTETNFDKLIQLRQEFQPYYKMITLHKNFQFNVISQMDEVFASINSESLRENVEQSIKELNKLLDKQFRGNQTYQTIMHEILEEYTNFEEYLSLIHDLRNPGLRERHWEIIIKITSFDRFRSQSVTLREVLNQKVIANEKELKSISRIASQELNFEKTLNILKKKWKDIRLIIVEQVIAPVDDGSNETFKVISNIPIIQEKMETDIIQIQKILTSPIVKFLENQIRAWKSSVLEKVHEFTDFWSKLQENFFKISTFFSNEKVRREIEQCYLAFKAVQKQWKNALNQIQSQNILIDVLQMKIWENISFLNEMIEKIKKQTFEYFNKIKRSNPKISFLSNEKIFEVFSYAEKNKEVFYNSIEECFPGVRKLRENQNGQIYQIQTLDGTYINLECPLKLDENYTLAEVLEMIEKNIRVKLEKALKNDGKIEEQLIQIVLLKKRFTFTETIQTCFKQKKQFYQFELDLQIKKASLITQMRKNCKKPFYLYMMEILEIGNQLRILRELTQLDITDGESFEWQKQIRYYFNEKKNFIVKVANYQKSYKFQLIKCQMFVQSPTSDRLFLNLCQAFSNKMFTCLLGHNNSGKIQILEFFGEICGRFILPIRVNSMITPGSIVQFLGIAASGLWMIFQEIQNLSKESLSVFEKNIELFWFNFQMNSSKIIDLKADQKLLSLNCEEVNIMATWQVKQNFQQISPEIRQFFRCIRIGPIHYKFILHSLLATIFDEDLDIQYILDIIKEFEYQERIGKLHYINKGYFIKKFIEGVSQKVQKCSQKYLNHEILFICFSETVNYFIKNQNGQISKEFYDLHLVQEAEKEKKNSRRKRASKTMNVKNGENLTFTKEFQCNIEKLIKILQNQKGAIVFSDQISGKSTLIGFLEKVRFENFSIKISKLCSLAYTEQQLYGSQEKSTHGYIHQIISSFHENPQPKTKYCGIHLDGEISSWVKPLITILEGYSSVPKPNGQILQCNSNVKLIFQADNLSSLEPNVLYDVGMLYLKDELQSKNILSKLLQTYFPNDEQTHDFILEVYTSIIESVLDFYSSCFTNKQILKNNELEEPEYSKMTILEMILRFFSILLKQEMKQKNKQRNKILQEDEFGFFVFAVIWTVGVSVPEQSRKTFCRHFKYLLNRIIKSKKNNQKYKLPPQQSLLFDYYYCGDGNWKYWRSLPVPQGQETKNEIFLNEIIALSYIGEKYIRDGSPLFFMGKQSLSKHYLFQRIIKNLPNEKFVKNWFVYRWNLSKKEMNEKLIMLLQSEKYSNKLKGFANGKNNLFYICDLNLPMKSHYENGNLVEFIRQFYCIGGYYLKDEKQPFYFQNFQFYGTVNKTAGMKIKLLRNINTIVLTNPENRQSDILKVHIKTNVLKDQYKKIMIKCTENLHEVLQRQLSSEATHEYLKFSINDMIKVMSGISKICQNDQTLLYLDHSDLVKNMLKKWVYMIKRVYGQKVKQNNSPLFYFINNVLMEQERVRYKTICASNNYYFTALQSSNFSYEEYTVEELTASIIENLQKQHPEKYYLKKIIKESDGQFMKLIIKFLNSFEFESSILLIVNEQKRRIKTIIKIVCELIKIKLVFTSAQEKLPQSEWNNILNKYFSQKQNHQNEDNLLFFFNNLSTQNEEILDHILTYARTDIFKPWQEYIEKNQFQDYPIFQKQQSQRQNQNCLKDFNFVLNFQTIPHYVFNNYPNLIHQSSVCFLQNTIIQGSTRSTKKIESDYIYEFQELRIEKCLTLTERVIGKIHDLIIQLHPELINNLKEGTKSSFFSLYCQFKNRIIEICNEKLGFAELITKKYSFIVNEKRKYELNIFKRNEELQILKRDLQNLQEELEKDQKAYEKNKKKDEELEIALNKNKKDTEKYEIKYLEFMNVFLKNIEESKNEFLASLTLKGTLAPEVKQYIEVLVMILPISQNKNKKQELIKDLNKDLIEGSKKVIKKIGNFINSKAKINEKSLQKAFDMFSKIDKMIEKEKKRKGNFGEEAKSFRQYACNVLVFFKQQINQSDILTKYEKMSKLLEKSTFQTVKRSKNQTVNELYSKYQKLRQRKIQLQEEIFLLNKEDEKQKEELKTIQIFLKQKNLLQLLTKTQLPKEDYDSLRKNAHNFALSLAIDLRYQTLLSIENENQSIIDELSEILIKDSQVEEKITKISPVNFEYLAMIFGVRNFMKSKNIDSKIINDLKEKIFKYCFLYEGYVLVEKQQMINNCVFIALECCQVIHLKESNQISKNLLSGKNEKRPILVIIDTMKKQQILKITQLLMDEETYPSKCVIIYSSYFSEDLKASYPYVPKTFTDFPLSYIAKRFQEVYEGVQKNPMKKVQKNTTFNEQEKEEIEQKKIIPQEDNIQISKVQKLMMKIDEFNSDDSEKQKQEFLQKIEYLIALIEKIKSLNLFDSSLSIHYQVVANIVTHPLFSPITCKYVIIFAKFYYGLQLMVKNEMFNLEDYEEKIKEISYGLISLENKGKKKAKTPQHFLFKNLFSDYLFFVEREINLQILGLLSINDWRMEIYDWAIYTSCCIKSLENEKIKLKYKRYTTLEDKLKCIYEKIEKNLQELSNSDQTIWGEMHKHLLSNEASWKACFIKNYEISLKISVQEDLYLHLPQPFNTALHKTSKLLFAIILSQYFDENYYECNFLRKFVEDLDLQLGKKKKLQDLDQEQSKSKIALHLKKLPNLQTILDHNQHKKYIIKSNNGNKGFEQIIHLAKARFMEVQYPTKEVLEEEVKCSDKKSSFMENKSSLLSLLPKQKKILILSIKQLGEELVQRALEKIDLFTETYLLNEDLSYSKLQFRVIVLKNSEKIHNLPNLYYMSPTNVENSIISTQTIPEIYFIYLFHNSNQKRIYETLPKNIKMKIIKLLNMGQAFISNYQEILEEQPNHKIIQIFYIYSKLIERQISSWKKEQKHLEKFPTELKKANFSSMSFYYNINTAFYNLIQPFTSHDHQPNMYIANNSIILHLESLFSSQELQQLAQKSVQELLNYYHEHKKSIFHPKTLKDYEIFQFRKENQIENFKQIETASQKNIFEQIYEIRRKMASSEKTNLTQISSKIILEQAKTGGLKMKYHYHQKEDNGKIIYVTKMIEKFKIKVIPLKTFIFGAFEDEIQEQIFEKQKEKCIIKTDEGFLEIDSQNYLKKQEKNIYPVILELCCPTELKEDPAKNNE